MFNIRRAASRMPSDTLVLKLRSVWIHNHSNYLDDFQEQIKIRRVHSKFQNMSSTLVLPLMHVQESLFHFEQKGAGLCYA